MKKKVISFSLYGQDPMYLQGALENVRLAREHYPGWVCHYYCGFDVPTDLVARLWSEGAEVSREPAQGAHHGLFWRFYVASDASLERFVVRDTDSRLNAREAAAVAEWEASGKAFHVMRDHPLHVVRRWPMPAGMWGALGGLGDDLRQAVKGWGRFSRKGSDQDFLAHWMWPRARKDCLQHNPVNFPGPKLPNGAFVGMPVPVSGPLNLSLENAEEPPWMTLVLRVGEEFRKEAVEPWLQLKPRPELVILGCDHGSRASLAQSMGAHHAETEKQLQLRTGLVAYSRGQDLLDPALLTEAKALGLERSRFLLLGKGVQIFPRGLFCVERPFSSAGQRQIPVFRAQSWK